MSLLLSTFDLQIVTSCIWINVIIYSLWEYKIMRRQSSSFLSLLFTVWWKTVHWFQISFKLTHQV